MSDEIEQGDSPKIRRAKECARARARLRQINERLPKLADAAECACQWIVQGIRSDDATAAFGESVQKNREVLAGLLDEFNSLWREIKRISPAAHEDQEEAERGGNGEKDERSE